VTPSGSVQAVRRPLRALILSLLVLLPATPSLAAQPLPTGISSILRSYGLAVGGTGVTIVDLSDGQVAYRYHAWTRLAPASNEKLITTVAALSTLRPGFRYETTLDGSGERTGATYHGDIFLVGAGDPTLTGGGLDTLAKRLRQSGVRHIAGRVLGDETIFDRMRFGPQWKSSFYGTESPPLSGLTVNRNLAPNGHMLPYPALTAARLMRKALREHGITVSGRAATGKAAFGATELSSVRSKPLWMILRSMDRASDNFMAEMVIKAVGALGGGKGSTAAGLAVAQSVLQETIGDDAKDLHLVDGSGLSAANRLTASALAELLARTSTDPTLGPPLRQALAVAGVNGTLRDRPAGAGRVLAKTGTLDGVSSLSGYATTQSGARFAFSILMNGRSLSDSEAHEAQDKIAALLTAQP
jgi:D-alanyl-D-alanine carboxypeptidase/D-alanyl-D-alanine-endopeptidase (penicillin-binding protein 4)